MNGNQSSEIAAMAYPLADSAARSDIECMCVPEVIEGVVWFNTDSVTVAEDKQFVAEALAYLDARAIATHHPTRPALVNFREVGA